MTEREIRKRAKAFLEEYSIDKGYESLCVAAESLGYVIAEFDPCLPISEEMKLIRLLNLSDKISSTRGLTYACGEHRVLFVDDRLTDKEKLIVMAHELGHIVLGHMEHNYVIGRDVLEEYEAYMFAYFCLK